MGWIRSRIGNGPSRKAHGPFPHDLTFFKTDITHDTHLRHIRYLEVVRILIMHLELVVIEPLGQGDGTAINSGVNILESRLDMTKRARKTLNY